MSTLEVPFVRNVFHPSDFSDASENAFAHALATALLRQTKLTLFHVGGESLAEDLWGGFPSVRGTLERWGFLEEGSPKEAIFESLKVRVEKISAFGKDPLKTITRHLAERPTDLIVLATEGREGLPRWLKKSVSEELARRSRTMSLFVPKGVRGFVSREDGSFHLRNVLIPMDHDPGPQAAMQIAMRVATAIGENTTIHLLSVGDGDPPRVDLPEDPAWSWNTLQRKGDVVAQILATAEEISADLIAMVTKGRQGFLDAMRGSTTEQVLRRAPCPLLAVPTAWLEEMRRWQ